MQANRCRDTQPEMDLRRAMHALGLRYRVSVRPLDGIRRTADAVFRRARVAVFCDGCFWHGCPDHFSVPRVNSLFWTSKIQANRDRDVDTVELLSAAGWLSFRVWEHENMEEAARHIAEAVWERLRGTSA